MSTLFTVSRCSAKSLLVVLAFIQASLAQNPTTDKASQHFNYDKNIGTVNTLLKPTLVIHNPYLKAGTHLVLVFPEIPQKLAEAIVLRKTTLPAATGKEGEYAYTIKILHKAPTDPALALGVLANISQFHLDKGHIHANLDGTGCNKTFRSACSSDGVHLTVWDDTPLTDKREWHGYFYLGYDVEPTGTPKDY